MSNYEILSTYLDNGNKRDYGMDCEMERNFENVFP